MNRPKNLLHHSVLLATAFLAVLVMGALPVRAQQTAASPSVSATEKPYLFEWVYKVKWGHAERQAQQILTGRLGSRRRARSLR